MDVWREKERAARKKKVLLFFLTGFVLGVFYITLLGHSENSNMLMSSYFFSKYKYMEYSSMDLLIYILRSRFTSLLFLWLMGLTVIGSGIVLLFGLWAGFSFGLIVTMAVLKLGIAGILLCVISMVPQYIIYFPAYAFGVLRIYELGQKKKVSGAYVAVLFIVGFLILIGGILESYVNPLLLKSLIEKI